MCRVIPSDAQLMLLPPKLETLEMHLGELDAAGLNTAVQTIGRLTVLRHLTLQFASRFSDVSFAPLSKCAALTKMTFEGAGMNSIEEQPTDAHIDQLRALHHLSYVSIADLDSDSLTKLLRAPHSLEWTELRDVYDIDAVSAPALRNLPGLLTLYTWGCCDVSFLPALSQLQTLHLECSDEPWDADMTAVTGDAVVEALSGCRRLAVLILTAPVTSKHLSILLPRLPLLHTLSLLGCRELESLQFLSDVPSLQHTVCFFFLKDSPALHSSELRHVLALKNLETPLLVSSFSEPLDGLTQHLLTPPSALLPKLTEFDYEPAPPAVAYAFEVEQSDRAIESHAHPGIVRARCGHRANLPSVPAQHHLRAVPESSEGADRELPPSFP